MDRRTSVIRHAGLVLGAAALIVGSTVLVGSPRSLGTVVALAAGTAAPALLRRRWPLLAATASAVVAVVGMAIPGWTGQFIAMAMFCSAAYHRPRPWLLGAVALCWSALCAVTIGVPSAPNLVIEMLLVATAPVAAGYALRMRHNTLVAQAQLHHVEAERIVAEERALLAREVHDAVGHHLTAIRLQASSVRYVGGASPIAQQALTTIGDLAGTALTEVRTLATALSTPSPGLAGVDALAARLSAPDCPVTVTRAGEPAELSPHAQHCAYRIVQEALTNAVRHADASRIDVRIEHRGAQLRLTVEDNGPGTDPAGTGRGIAGMRERAALVGGTLEITSRAPSGWRVEAALPV